MKVEIKSRWSSSILFAIEAGSFKAAVELAVKGGADLSWAELSGANLSGAYLSGAYLDEIKHDLWAVLTLQPREVLGLRQALIDGKVDGSTYDGGGCHCLVGTIADVAGRDYKELDRLKPDADRPTERWFLGIKPGDTPDSNQIAELALEWIDEWLSTPVGRLFDADSAASNQQEADRA